MKQTKRKSAVTAATVNGAQSKFHINNNTHSEKVQAATVSVINACDRSREYGRNHITPECFQSLSCNSTEKDIKEVCAVMLEKFQRQYNPEPLTREIFSEFFKLLAMEYIAGIKESADF